MHAGRSETGRTDLSLILLTGVPGLNYTGPTQSDLLRLNTALKPGVNGACPGGTASAAAPDRLAVLDADLCGWPNGRRLGDDVVDIELRAIAQGYGTFLNGAFGLPNKTPNNLLGDGVDAQRRAVLEHVPVRRGPAPGLRGSVGDRCDKAGGAPGRTPLPFRPTRRRMRRTRLILGAATATATAAVLLLGGIFHDSSAATPSTAIAPAASPEALQAGFSPGGNSTAASVSKLQAKLLANPNDVTSLDALGLAYQQRARETGDPAYYTKSEQVLNRALRLAPRDLIATSGLGSLALSRHRFAEALTLGRKAHAISPTTALNYGITGDALVELGRYPAAFEAFDTMATLKPSLSSYARVSHGLELLGRVPEAIETMKLAVGAAQGQGEPEAWTRFQLGKLYWSIGRVAAAERQDRAALRVFPGYHYALDALARDRGGEGPQPRRDRARAAGRRHDPAAAVRGAARRPLPRERPAAGGEEAVRADRRHRAAARRERRQDRSRDGAVRRRPRHPPARRPRAGTDRPRRAPLDRRRRRPRVGALPERPLRARRSATRSSRSASARATRSSSSTAA